MTKKGKVRGAREPVGLPWQEVGLPGPSHHPRNYLKTKKSTAAAGVSGPVPTHNRAAALHKPKSGWLAEKVNRQVTLCMGKDRQETGKHQTKSKEIRNAT